MSTTTTDDEARREERRRSWADVARRRAEAEARRDAFARALGGARRLRWCGRHLTRMPNRTGERPERVKERRLVLGELGLGAERWGPCLGGVFDHGEMWALPGGRYAVVGHPYGVDKNERAWLAELARFPTLRVSVDDRPSYYGFGTNHVRVENAAAYRPFAPPRSTRKTRAAALAARRAFAEEFAEEAAP
jgi:hypothetical protein